jgi:starch-binding outer membrane protein, SusD/RagB family
MKRNIKKVSTILLSTIILLSSCKKQLDTLPEDSLLQLTTFSNIQDALNGCYLGFRSSNYYDNRASSGSASAWSALPDLMGDDFIETSESLGNWRTMSEATFASDNGVVQSTFSQPYEIISRANNILQSISKYEVGSTKLEANRIKGQAYAIRAHAHFDLLRYFAQDYDRNSTALGIPYVKAFDPLNPLTVLPSRQTVKSNYDDILADLNTALINFRAADDNPNNDARNFIDSVTVYAIKTRVNYYASQWSEVISNANIALNLRNITDETGYATIFTVANEGVPENEVFWAIPSDGNLQPGRATNGTAPSYRVSTALKTKIQALGGAYVNSSVTRFNQSSTAYPFPKTLCWKYPGVRSFKVYRAGELLLMRAEAKQKTSIASALTDLNLLRTNRGVSIGSETGTNLLNAILEIRRIELLGEGHRWFDLRRTTKSINRLECGVTGSSTSNICTVLPTSRSWTFPIPFNDVRVNPNLVQNAGY